jgi:hypothetical protein
LKRKRVIRLEDKKIYSSLQDVRKEFSGILSKTLRENHLAYGYHWAYYTENFDYDSLLLKAKNKSIECKRIRYSRLGKRVFCLNNRRVYDTISQAARELHMFNCEITKSINQEKFVKGYAFTWYPLKYNIDELLTIYKRERSKSKNLESRLSKYE